MPPKRYSVEKETEEYEQCNHCLKWISLIRVDVNGQYALTYVKPTRETIEVSLAGFLTLKHRKTSPQPF